MPTQTTEVVKADAMSVATMPPAQQITVAMAFQAVLERNISKENLEVAKQLLAMDAERQFAAAFVALQADLPEIVAESVIPNRGKYARFENVMHQIAPFLKKHGFTVSFSQALEIGRVISTCHLTHSAGHTRQSSFAVRVSGKADTETQADTKASTTAKRKALQDALNIVIHQDCLNEEDDASLEGGPITADQSDELQRRVNETNTDVAAFLKYAGAKTFAEISSSKYDILDQQLQRKEKQGK